MLHFYTRPYYNFYYLTRELSGATRRHAKRRGPDSARRGRLGRHEYVQVVAAQGVHGSWSMAEDLSPRGAGDTLWNVPEITNDASLRPRYSPYLGHLAATSKRQLLPRQRQVGRTARCRILNYDLGQRLMAWSWHPKKLIKSTHLLFDSKTIMVIEFDVVSVSPPATVKPQVYPSSIMVCKIHAIPPPALTPQEKENQYSRPRSHR